VDRRALYLTAGYAVVAGAIAQAGIPSVAAAPLLAPLVLFAPGYALLMTLEGASARPDMPGRRFVMAVALSMASVALGGLVLNALFSLTRLTWVLWLAGLTCCLSAVAFVRNRDNQVVAAAAALRPAARPLESIRGSKSWGAFATSTMVLVAFASAVVVTELSSRKAFDKPVTQLSLMPTSDRNSLWLVLTNMSGRAERVTLTLTKGDQRPVRRSLVVGPSRSWSREESIPAHGGLHASLTRPGGPHPFSEVSWGR
jgi:hypothetical protein